MSVRAIYIHTLDLSQNETSETFVIYNAISLSQQIDELILFVINRSNRPAEEIIKDKFNLNDIPKNLRIITRNSPKRTKLSFYLQVKRYISRLPDDFIVITRAHGVLKWLFTIYKPGKKVLFETHDYFFDLSKRVDIGRKDRKKKSAIERKYFPQVSGIIASNDYQAKLYQEHFPDIPVQSFPTGLNQIFEVGGKRVKRVAYIGTLEPRLGIDRIMKVREALPANYDLVVIGGRGRDDIEAFKSLFHGSTLPNNIILTGWLNKKELHEVLKTIRVGLLPLYTDQNKFALPLKIFDYFAFGIPVISSYLPAIEKMIIDEVTGFYVDWEKPEKVAEIISQLMEDDGRWAELSANVYEKAQTMTWNNRARAQRNFLKMIE